MNNQPGEVVSLMSLSARRSSSCNPASVHRLLGEIEICCPDPNFLELPASDPEVKFSPRALVLEVEGAYRPSTPAKKQVRTACRLAAGIIFTDFYETAEKEGLSQGHFPACTKRPSKPITLLDQKITRIVNKEVSRVKLSVVVFILVVFLQMSDNRRVSEV